MLLNKSGAFYVSAASLNFQFKRRIKNTFFKIKRVVLNGLIKKRKKRKEFNVLLPDKYFQSFLVKEHFSNKNLQTFLRV